MTRSRDPNFRGMDHIARLRGFAPNFSGCSAYSAWSPRPWSDGELARSVLAAHLSRYAIRRTVSGRVRVLEASMPPHQVIYLVVARHISRRVARHISRRGTRAQQHGRTNEARGCVRACEARAPFFKARACFLLVYSVVPIRGKHAWIQYCFLKRCTPPPRPTALQSQQSMQPSMHEPLPCHAAPASCSPCIAAHHARGGTMYIYILRIIV